MTTSIYDLHDKAFAQVSAYVVVKDGAKVATIALKFPKDGAGRVHAYVHWLGVPMVRGHAGGYGYDKRSAAVADAVRKVTLDDREDAHRDDLGQPVTDRAEFIDALTTDGGEYFDRKLENAGFTVLQAV